MAEGVSGEELVAQAPFGERLRRMREAAGLTQEELALRAGLTAKGISALERGERKRPYPHTVRALADALGHSEDERAAFLASVPRKDKQTREAPVPDPASNLPTPSTLLLGRERELGEISALLREARLLTLTGTGGVGKTRLAVEATRDAARLFPDGAVFVTLSALDDADLVVPTIGRSLGLRESGGRSPWEALRGHLSEKQLLLALDNFEQVLGAAPEVAALIESCRGLTVLVTSRAPLRVRGEQEYPVGPLALPASTVTPTAEEVADSPSGHLFAQRARAASPTFELTGENVGAVAAICWRLAGLPLALELAAARTRFLDPATLLSRLDQAISTGWARDVPERQRTMRSTLDWSYDLLSGEEKTLFRRLSVFAGGFSLEAAEEVGASEGVVSPDEVLDLLGRLVEQSLVTAGPDREGTRYDMLEPVRQYAGERLEESSEAAGRDHAAFFLAMAERAQPELRGPRQVERLERLEKENDNLRAAMTWALSRDEEVASAARLAWALWLFWLLRGHHAEGRQWTEALLGRDLPPASRARGAMAASAMAHARGDYGACEEHASRALELSRRTDDDLCAGSALVALGLGAMDCGDLEEAASSFEESLSLHRRTGEEGMVPMLRVWSGTVLLLQGDRDRAVPMFEEGLELARRRGDRIGAYTALFNLAQVALSRGDHALATRMLEEGVAFSEQVRERANLAFFLEGLAAVAGLEGEAERAALLFGAAEGLLEEVGAPVYNYYQPDRSLYERAMTAARARLDGQTWTQAWTEGKAMGFGEAIAYALAGDKAPS